MEQGVAAEPTARRRWIAGVAGAIAVLSVAATTWVVTRDPGEQERAVGPSVSTSVSVSVSPSRNQEAERSDNLHRFGDAIEAALQRVAPGAVLDPTEKSFGYGLGSDYQYRGLLTVAGRTGILNATLNDGKTPALNCADYEECKTTTGPCGSTIHVVQFQRTVDQGQPRDIEFRASARRGSAEVLVTVDNSAVWWTVGGSVQRRQTGQEPPLTVDQLRQIVNDPATNALAPSTC